ncbi:MAG: DUF167 domain-containing protein [Chloroflexi bacterium]|nr:DUF167 domain-containing protein [Chloroflexota bacterium]
MACMDQVTATLAIRVVPGAPRDQVMGIADGVWRVKVAAPPVGGRANDRLISFLAEIMGVASRQVCLVRGHTSRQKVLEVTGVGPETAAERLAGAVHR